MKKLISLMIGIAMAVSLLPISLAADEEGEVIDAPTYSFDTSLRTMDFEVFGVGIDAGMSFGISKAEKVSGTSIEVKVKNTEERTEDFGGIWISADKLGLESFEGCRITMSIRTTAEYADVSTFMQLISTEPEWDQTNITTSLKDVWRKVTIEIPEGHKNKYVGLKIPVTVPYTGTIMYIDNVYVYDADGVLFENVDQYIVPEVTTPPAKTERTEAVTYVTSQVEKNSEGSGAIVYVIVAVLGVAIAGVIVVLLMRRRNKFY